MRKYRTRKAPSRGEQLHLSESTLIRGEHGKAVKSTGTAEYFVPGVGFQILHPDTVYIRNGKAYTAVARTEFEVQYYGPVTA